MSENEIVKIGVILQTRKDNDELIQDFVKRTLKILFEHKLIPNNEIERLQEKEYSKQTFDINFPLLVKDEKDTFSSSERKHRRYWYPEKVGEFYVCNHWQKKYTETYEDKIAKWLKYLERISR